MAKSARRNQAEGTLDKIAGRVMETFGKLTGNSKTKNKGRAARGRGKARSGTGRMRRSAR
jgi:uncharacterized protein YjbJ (UPF0337 family)